MASVEKYIRQWHVNRKQYRHYARSSRKFHRTVRYWSLLRSQDLDLGSLNPTPTPDQRRRPLRRCKTLPHFYASRSSPLSFRIFHVTRARPIQQLLLHHLFHAVTILEVGIQCLGDFQLCLLEGWRLKIAWISISGWSIWRFLYSTSYIALLI